ncbi:MAG: hypothetical protein ABJC12_01390 [Saprospiraceae bacterium]
MRIIILLIAFNLFGCYKPQSDLEIYFAKLKYQSPKHLIDEFKNTPLDTAVIHNERFNEIFIVTSNKIFQDSSEVKRMRNFLKREGIDSPGLDGEYIVWAMIASFHKYLNHKNFNFADMMDEMQVLSDKIEKK